jgi:hypothetical protein
MTISSLETIKNRLVADEEDLNHFFKEINKDIDFVINMVKNDLKNNRG